MKISINNLIQIKNKRIYKTKLKIMAKLIKKIYKIMKYYNNNNKFNKLVK